MWDGRREGFVVGRRVSDAVFVVGDVEVEVTGGAVGLGLDVGPLVGYDVGSEEGYDVGVEVGTFRD